MSLFTTLMGLIKPAGNETYTRKKLNDNMDLIDKNIIMLAFGGSPYAYISKGPIILNEDGDPSSRTFTGSNGLSGTISWSYTESTITKTISITSPEAISMTYTTNINDGSSEGVPT